MSLEGKTRTRVYIGVAAALTAAAVGIYYIQTRTPEPDAATRAAMERNQAIQANMDPPPPQPDLPVESRAPRGAVPKK